MGIEHRTPSKLTQELNLNSEELENHPGHMITKSDPSIEYVPIESSNDLDQPITFEERCEIMYSTPDL